MADIIDNASDTEYLFRQADIENRQRLASKPIPTSKVCLSCGARTKGGGRWCDSDCRDTWSKEQSR